MNLQQVAPPRASSNGYVHRRVDREIGVRTENKMHSGTPAFSHSGLVNGGKGGGAESPSRDRLIYVTTYLIGHRVEVHVKNGSVISGIFHAADAEKDFGIVLKMAQVIKDGSVKGHKLYPDTTKKPQTMIIPARELVQVLAKDVSLSSDEFSDGHARERRKDFMIDSAISQSHHVELERELEPWTPDTDDQEFPELDNIFDGTWNRNWDQFETNETLFGVKSTFDEELYTTRLERGPHMRDIEREASRIAREIEGEETRDLHLAEERGVFRSDDFGLDEESRYSAVHREVDDGRFEELDNSFSDACSTETFGGSGSAVSGLSPDISTEKVRNEAQPSTTCSSVLSEETQASQSKAIDPVDLKRLSASATSYDPCGQENKHSSSESAVPTIITATNEPANLSLRPGSSTSSAREHVGTASASSAPGLSPSSSIGSLSSEKSTLNPYAKEFKLNPNAKSFAPSVSSRAQAPVSEGPFYYTGNIPQMHNLPVGVGFGASFGGHQPSYNLQGAQMQSPQTYLPPNSPLYGQQMIIGQPRPVFYMPTYQPEMPYRGRNF